MTESPKRLPSYRIYPHTFAPTHPLGIKPSGNAFFEEDLKEVEKHKQKLLGKFGKFPEDLLIHLISFIESPRDLLALGSASRVFYAYTYSEELWRKFYVDEFTRLEENQDPASTSPCPFDCKNWKGSWRKTLLKTDVEALVKTNGLVFSDYLYRPYQCSQIDFEYLFRKVVDLEAKSRDLGHTLNSDFGVARIDEAALTLQDFEVHHINKPFILQSSSRAERWPQWNLKNLVDKFGNTKFRQEAVKWTLSFYSDYFSQNYDESPLYLFDCNSVAIQALKKEYEAPKIFQNDLFKVFQEGEVQCRPDHRWLIIGPQGSGSTFHKDPNYTSAWNTVLTGKKLWIMLPPDVKPPGVSTDEDEEEVTSPIGVAEWVLSGFYNDAVKLAQDGKCLITVTFPGECIYVPSGWWHTVINLTDSVALTENFVPEPVLPKTLLFFSSKRRQLSGFHLEDTLKALRKFLESNKPTEDPESRSNFYKIKKFLTNCENQQIDNRDCGLSESDPELPIFEFFVELLRLSKFGANLDSALASMRAMKSEAERESQKLVTPATKISGTWTALAAESKNAFSFGFDLN
ncbi:LANO_0G14708g1_1 [Lachancea nothofagi CBS 11611]|uniref:LANO_0G14708g1_1 n=1 Tax=Lachancea nothofagi CBS 11611 TaxID=1266666 RepID=A0A1G4KK49_9SACH|nr:LANO_0G14708g1_1 [Lachancea nothofagi CBS 11611]